MKHAWFLFAILFVPTALTASPQTSLDGTSPPMVRVGTIPESVTTDGSIQFSVTFTWQGEDDKFRFMIPKLSLDNLNLLRVGQSVTRRDSTISKTFTFELEPIQAGEAQIRNFPFFFQRKDKPDLIQSEIAGFQTQVVPSGSVLSRNLRMIVAGTSTLIALVGWVTFWRSRKRRKMPVSHSGSSCSLENEYLDRLIKLKKILTSDTDPTEALTHLSNLFETYCQDKWGTAEKDLLIIKLSPQLDRKECQEIQRVLVDMQTWKFSEELIRPYELKTLSDRIQTIIHNRQLIEPINVV